MAAVCANLFTLGMWSAETSAQRSPDAPMNTTRSPCSVPLAAMGAVAGEVMAVVEVRAEAA
jgi:hypothetical protein